MAEILFKRIIHPVGHGAFFTEQFVNPMTNETLYNVVYDCGSLSSGMKNRIHHISDEIFKERKINILFLSHFDDDHVNCVKHLVKQNYIDGATIFIPLLKEISFIGVLPYDNNYQYISNLNGYHNIKVINVKPENDDRTPETLTNIEDIYDKVINSGTKISTRILDYIWCYVPFNICIKDVLEEFRSRIEDKGLDYDRLQDPEYVSIPAIQKVIKGIYRNMGKKTDKNTIINFNSLQVLSFPVKTEYCKEYSRYSTCPYYFDDYYRWNRGYTKYKVDRELLYPGSCMYTGDTSANNTNVWKKLISIIDNYLKDDQKKNRKLVLFQLSHHGSVNSNDNSSLNENRIYAAFANYSIDGRSIFHNRLAIDYGLKRKPLLLVTEKELTQFEEHW